MVALAGVLWWAQARVELPDVPLLFLPIVVAASLLGVGPGVVAAAASTLAYHVFFTAPAASLRVAAMRDVASILVYLLVSITITLLVARIRAALSEARWRAEVADALQQLASSGLRLTPSDEPTSVAEAIADAIGSPACLIWMREGPQLVRWAVHDIVPSSGEREASAAWVEREGQPVTIGEDAGRRLRLIPIRAAGGVSGALGVEETGRVARFLEDPRFLEGVSGLVALFWSRATGRR